MISHIRTPRAALKAVRHLNRNARLAVVDFYDSMDDLCFQPLKGRRASQRGLAALMDLPASGRKLSEAVLEALVDDGLAAVAGSGAERVITVYRAEDLYLDATTRLPTITPPAPDQAKPGTSPDAAPHAAPHGETKKQASEGDSRPPIKTPAPRAAPRAAPDAAPHAAPPPIYARAHPPTSASSQKTSSSSSTSTDVRAGERDRGWSDEQVLACWKEAREKAGHVPTGSGRRDATEHAPAIAEVLRSRSQPVTDEQLVDGMARYLFDQSEGAAGCWPAAGEKVFLGNLRTRLARYLPAPALHLVESTRPPAPEREYSADELELCRQMEAIRAARKTASGGEQ